MVERVTRFGVSLSTRLIKNFDTLLAELGYTNRSKAIADAVNDFISQKRIAAADGYVIGSISYLYDHHVPDVNKKLVRLQHGYEKNIKSTMHSHITHAECVEVLIVEGGADDIHGLYGGLSAIRGVENCKLAVLKTDKA